MQFVELFLDFVWKPQDASFSSFESRKRMAIFTLPKNIRLTKTRAVSSEFFFALLVVIIFLNTQNFFQNS